MGGVLATPLFIAATVANAARYKGPMPTQL